MRVFANLPAILDNLASYLSRERAQTSFEVLRVSRLRASLARLNPSLPPEAVAGGVDEIIRDRSATMHNAPNFVSNSRSRSDRHLVPVEVGRFQGRLVAAVRESNRVDGGGRLPSG